MNCKLKIVALMLCSLGLINILFSADNFDKKDAAKPTEKVTLKPSLQQERSRLNAFNSNTLGETTIFFENFESGAIGWFTDGGHNSMAGKPEYRIENSHWELVTTNSYSPTHSYWIDDNFDVKRDFLISPLIKIPTEINNAPLASAKLSFMVDIDNPGYLNQETGYLADYFTVYAGKEEIMFHRTNINPFEGSYSWYCGYDDGKGYPNNSFQYLTSPAINLTTAKAPVTLTFNHKIIAERYWDLAVVSVSINDFKTIDANIASFDTTLGWEAATINLSSYVGKTIRLRFRFLSDVSTTVPLGGWWIDNVLIKDVNAVNFLQDKAETGATVLTPFGISIQKLFHDYDRTSTSTVEWNICDSNTIYNGSMNLFDAGIKPGDNCYLAFQYRTDGSNDQGELVSRGLFIDDIKVTGTPIASVDAGVREIFVGYPTTVGQETPIAVQVINAGSKDQTGIELWYKLDNDSAKSISPLLSIKAGKDTIVIFSVAMASLGKHSMTAYTVLSGDENPSNNSIMSDEFVVHPVGKAELGYDNRFVSDYLSSNTCIVYFTPLTEIKGTNSFDLEKVQIVFYNTEKTDELKVMIAEAQQGKPLSTTNIIYEASEIIPSERYYYLEIDLSENISAKNIKSDFIVKVDFSISNGGSRIVMDAGTPFTNHNIYFDSDDNKWYYSKYGRKINALISYLDKAEIMSVQDVPNDQGGKVLVSWHASQNDQIQIPRPISQYVLWHKVDPDLGKIQMQNLINVPSVDEFNAYGARAQKNDVVLIGSATSGDLWRFVVAVPAHPDWLEYSALAETWKDSTIVNGLYLNYYIVSAYDKSDCFVDSEIGSGYSVDNLAPEAPKNFQAQKNSNGVMLSWDTSEARDFKYYALYRNDKSEPICLTTEVSYLDTAVVINSNYNYRLTAFDFSGNEGRSAEITILFTYVSDNQDPVPNKYMVYNNYPNPFNSITTIKFSLPITGRVTIKILNVHGQEITTLLNCEKSAGYHSVSWNADNNSSGVYFYTIETGSYKEMKKMALIK